MLLSVTTQIVIYKKIDIAMWFTYYIYIFEKLHSVIYAAFGVSKYFSYNFSNFTCHRIFTGNFIFYATKRSYLLFIHYIYILLIFMLINQQY